MVGGSADPAFDAKFREFLMEPGTQEVIAADQAKELGIMRKIDEMEKLEELQGQREQLAVAMQDLDPEAQRLIYPILRLKMVQHILFSALKESRRSGTSFVQSVRSPSLLRMLEKVRDELNNDPENARRIEAEWFHNVKLGIDHQVKNTPKKERQVLPATQMLPLPLPLPLTLTLTLPLTLPLPQARCCPRPRCSPSSSRACSCASTATISTRKATTRAP